MIKRGTFGASHFWHYLTGISGLFNANVVEPLTKLLTDETIVDADRGMQATASTCLHLMLTRGGHTSTLVCNHLQHFDVSKLSAVLLASDAEGQASHVTFFETLLTKTTLRPQMTPNFWVKLAEILHRLLDGNLTEEDGPSMLLGLPIIFNVEAFIAAFELAPVRDSDQAVGNNEVSPGKLVDAVGKSLKHKNSHVRAAAATTIGKLAVYSTDSNTFVSSVVDLLADEAPEVRKSAVIAIRDFIKNPAFHLKIRESLSLIGKGLEDVAEYVRNATVETLGELASHTTISREMRGLMRQSLQWLGEDIWQRRDTAAQTVYQFAKHSLFDDEIRDCVPSFFNLLEDEHPDVRTSAATTIGELSKHTVFVEKIREGVPRILKLLDDKKWRVRKMVVTLLAELVKSSISLSTPIIDLSGASQESFVDVIFKLLQDPDSDVQHATAMTIGELGRQSKFNEEILPRIPRIAIYLRESDWRFREVATTTLGELAENSAFHEVIGPYVAQIVDLLQDHDPDVQNAATTTIGKLAKQPGLLDAIHGSVNKIVEFLVSDSARVVRISAFTLNELAAHTAFTDTMRGVVGQVEGLGKRRPLAAQVALDKLSEYREPRSCTCTAFH
ncbi:armadillo-type protein [Mycena rebaudengoi]|nr:armadillo-type protein [Mycena rebaudengoi]